MQACNLIDNTFLQWINNSFVLNPLEVEKSLNVKSRTSNRYALGGKGRTVIASKYLLRLGKS